MSIAVHIAIALNEYRCHIAIALGAVQPRWPVERFWALPFALPLCAGSWSADLRHGDFVEVGADGSKRRKGHQPIGRVYIYATIPAVHSHTVYHCMADGPVHANRSYVYALGLPLRYCSSPVCCRCCGSMRTIRLWCSKYSQHRSAAGTKFGWNTLDGLHCQGARGWMHGRVDAGSSGGKGVWLSGWTILPTSTALDRTAAWARA